MYVTILLIHFFSFVLQLFSSKRGIRLPSFKKVNRASPFINALCYGSLGKKYISKYMVIELLLSLFYL